MNDMSQVKSSECSHGFYSNCPLCKDERITALQSQLDQATAALAEVKKWKEECEQNKSTADHLTKAQKYAKDQQDWIDSLCEQLCTMEEVLGFKSDCYNIKGAWVPTIGPWVERVRDLIAAEGELGDVKEQLTQAHKERDEAVDRLKEAHRLLEENSNGYVEHLVVWRADVEAWLKGGEK